jgi:hypothetical protein
MTRVASGISACAAALVWTAPAAAHPVIDEARALADSAQFELAIEALDRAEAGDDLAPDEVVELLRQRAIAEFALGHDRALGRDLARLASLGWQPPPDDEAFPPALVERFGAVAERTTPLGLSVEAESVAGGLQIRATLLREVDGLVRAVRFRTRLAGGSWLTSEGREAQALAPAGSVVEYYVEVVGPGGAVILYEGSETAPLSARPLAVVATERDAPAPPITERTTDDSEGMSAGAWVAISGGAVAVVVGVVVTVILLSASSDTNNLDPASVRWP